MVLALKDPYIFDFLTLARRHFPESVFRQVLADPPAGLFDPRSWAYWHLVFGLVAPPEPPRRRL